MSASLYHDFDADIAANHGNVPRPIMPQVDEADFEPLFAYLAHYGVEVRRDKVRPDDLCFRQDIDPAHVHEMPPGVMAKPILVSREGCVIDGNHRACRHRIEGSEAPAIRVMATFEEAFDLICAFERTYTLGAVGNVIRN